MCLLELILPFREFRVFYVLRRSQGCTLRFRPLSAQRRFATRKSIPAAIFSRKAKATSFANLGECFVVKNPHTPGWKWAFSASDYTIADEVNGWWHCITTRSLDPRSNQLHPTRYSHFMYNTYPIPTAASRNHGALRALGALTVVFLVRDFAKCRRVKTSHQHGSSFGIFRSGKGSVTSNKNNWTNYADY